MSKAWVLATAVVLGSVSCAHLGAQTKAQGTKHVPPLMRGTLWWVSHPDYLKWTKDDFAKEIDRQRAVGFDLLWVMGTPHLLQKASEADAAGAPHDVLGMILDLAAERHMRVIVDLPQGGWYGKNSAETIQTEARNHVQAIVARYGKSPALFGWYLNFEINPVEPGEQQETAFWRAVWGNVTKTCHDAAPHTKVTISPFFLLDEKRRRGFVYLTPEQYAAWWGATLKKTGIDILMLQDSGAEHLSFFMLEQREPFFAAARDACHAAGAEFWVNVETGHANAKDWDEFLAKGDKLPWSFTPMDWLEKKLQLAARYGDNVVNWGYFPFMNPAPLPGEEKPGAAEAYAAYKAYVDSVRR